MSSILLCCRNICANVVTKFHFSRLLTDIAPKARETFWQAACGPHAHRALQKYTHGFHANRDHAMCNIQNRSIPVAQLTQLGKLSNENLLGIGVLKSSQ
jgi:hypothetical protein